MKHVTIEAPEDEKEKSRPDTPQTDDGAGGNTILVPRRLPRPSHQEDGDEDHGSSRDLPISSMKELGLQDDTPPRSPGLHLWQQSAKSSTVSLHDRLAKLQWRERIRHFTWSFFTLTMATGGIANVLHAGNVTSAGRSIH